VIADTQLRNSGKLTWDPAHPYIVHQELPQREDFEKRVVAWPGQIPRMRFTHDDAGGDLPAADTRLPRCGRVDADRLLLQLLAQCHPISWPSADLDAASRSPRRSSRSLAV
jgi:hypothetical protein